MIELVELVADDTSSTSTSSSVDDNAVKEIRAFNKFSQIQSLAVKPVLVRQSSLPRLNQSIQISNFRFSQYSQIRSLSRDSESTISIVTRHFSRQVSEAHEFSTGYLDFLNKTTDSLYMSVWIKISMWLMASFLLAMFFVGNHYRNECPEIRELPYYLSVGGAAGFLKIVLIFLRRRDLPRKETDTKMADVVLQRYVRYTDNLLTLFLPVWSILGNFWYFSKPTPNFTAWIYEPTKWCNEVLYDWVFYKIVVIYLFISFVCIYIVVLTIAYYSLGASVLEKSGFID